ncbi:transmembrane protein 18 [Nephila pilipes]|uniref:Transmembrane protein 18 n=1 Tax=Nephila pilipes TaxID=299642 RepID=A0A8X6MTL8_NEPPI|nr:transmembrane protein 18 [Nephila pilipes]GFU13929.1 transmembrane protein 18 [Nephila pilipes]
METEFTAILTDSNTLVPVMQKEVLNIITFLRGIDWTEPWLIGLLTFHVVIMTVTIITRHHGNFQGVLFFLLLMLVLFAKSINELGASHWEYFSRQQYFDSHGMFISIVFSSPILLNCLIMVGHWLWLSGSMTIKIKQAQLKERLRAESRLRRQRREAELRNGSNTEPENAPENEQQNVPEQSNINKSNHDKAD